MRAVLITLALIALYNVFVPAPQCARDMAAQGVSGVCTNAQAIR